MGKLCDDEGFGFKWQPKAKKPWFTFPKGHVMHGTACRLDVEMECPVLSGFWCPTAFVEMPSKRDPLKDRAEAIPVSSGESLLVDVALSSEGKLPSGGRPHRDRPNFDKT